ncbi:MAG: hypothetical protein Q7R47_03155, partial [Candidatus Diapherotrites archaeon]|nr:hypothetical protein [Candidatus Diapherotrites archaeon]
RKNPMVQKLLSFTPMYRTNRGSTPSLDFLLTQRDELKIQAIRFAMSCEGSVSIKRKKKTGFRYALRLACTHPALVPIWQKLFQDIGLKMYLDMDKDTWSGIHGITTGHKEAFRRFAQLGGFLPENVKVTNGKNIGLEKNEVLRKILVIIKNAKKTPASFLSVQLPEYFKIE